MSAHTRLDALYAQLPTIACRGLCHEACGPIAASRVEVERVELAGRRTLTVIAPLTCSMLNAEKRCDAYEVRPMLCRVFGLTERLRCPEGCVPSRWLSDASTRAYLAAAERIGGLAVWPEGYAP